MRPSNRWTPWTTSQIRQLRKLYAYTCNKDLGKLISRRPTAVRAMAKRLGLRKFNAPPPQPRAIDIECEVQTLRDRIEELESLIGITQKLPELGLSRTEMKILGVIVSRKIASQETIHGAVYGGASERQVKTIDVHVCNIRRKLAPMGYEIKTSWGNGLYMEEAARASLKEAARVSA